MGKTTAIILASGAGERFGASVPKQFVMLNGKMVIQYSIDVMKNCDAIDHIVIVCHPDWLDAVKDLGVEQVVPGGSTRNESTWNGLMACPKDTRHVLIHDAVRPFLDEAILRRCIAALDHWPAVDTCIRSADTIIETDGDNVVSIPDRRRLRRGQTPQAFDYASIVSAYRYVKNRNATDDLSIAMEFGLKCGAVDGSIWNMKITEPHDLFVAERLMQYRDAIIRDPDVQGKSILLLGGSGGIGKEIARMLKELGAHITAPTRTEVDLSKDKLPDSLFQTPWDCIIHCAGVIGPGVEIADYEQIMNVNFRSAVLVADLAEKTMKQGGNIVYIGSSSAMKGRGRFPLYSASKAALNNFAESMAERFQDKNIRVNCINPAQTLTDMLSTVDLPADPSRALSVEYVARAIICYCDTPQTGQIINIRKNVDGAT